VGICCSGVYQSHRLGVSLLPTAGFDFWILYQDGDVSLWSLSTTLIAYENGQIGPPQILEEIHTGLEWVMQAVIGTPARDMTYARMAESLRDDGKLSPELTRQIILMKNLRRDAKHRAGRVDRDEFNRCYVPCIEALHHLLRLLPNGAS
jgi:hypothetical protein